MRHSPRALPAIATIALAIAGCGATKTTTRATPHPRGAVALPAGCVIAPGKGAIGACAPQTGSELPVPLSQLARGTKLIADFSNNDPLPCAAWGHLTVAGVYVKLTEAQSFIDQTAAGQVACARSRRADLYLGGYEFEHVCEGSPIADADAFARRAIALRLYGANTLPPTGDAEYGRCASQAAAQRWQQAWSDEARARLHRIAQYTGAWFWNPTFPCGFFDADYDWISGYVTYLASVPTLCGHAQIDLWQKSDRGANGYNSADLSIWTGSAASFERFVSARSAGPSHAQLTGWRQGRDASLRAYRARRCTRPIFGPAACAAFAGRVVYFQRRLYAGAPRVRCFGPAGQRRAAVCQILRPEVALLSGARAATARAQRRNRCTLTDRRALCAILARREGYFAAQITTNLY